MKVEVELRHLLNSSCALCGGKVVEKEGGILPQGGGGKPGGGGFKREADNKKFFKIPGCEILHIGPAGAAELNEALALKGEEGLAHGNAADPETPGDGGFGEELAGGGLAAEDLPAECGGGGVGA